MNGFSYFVSYYELCLVKVAPTTNQMTKNISFRIGLERIISQILFPLKIFFNELICLSFDP